MFPFKLPGYTTGIWYHCAMALPEASEIVEAMAVVHSFCATAVDDQGFGTGFGYCIEEICPNADHFGNQVKYAQGIRNRTMFFDDTITLTTYHESDIDIKYKMIPDEDSVKNSWGKVEPVYPDIVRVRSSGPAAELYPDSLGEYRRLPPDTTHNDHPVFQHSARDDRFIINIGKNIFRL